MRLVSEDTLAIITIFQEARGESWEGKLAVAEVIRNRMRQKYSSDGTVSGTVLRAFQFSGFNTQDPNRIPSFRIDGDDPVVKECEKAWKESEQTLEIRSSITKGAVLYYNPTIVIQKPKWVDLSVEVARVGPHVFYRPL